MPYNKFDLQTLVADFSLELSENTRLFPNIQPVEPSDLLVTILEENFPLATAINTEKARGELIIFPVLLEVKRRIDFQISIFSGKESTVDVERGLNGNPDFLISRSREQFFITAPVMTKSTRPRIWLFCSITAFINHLARLQSSYSFRKPLKFREALFLSEPHILHLEKRL